MSDPFKDEMAYWIETVEKGILPPTPCTAIDYAQIIQSLAFLTDEQRAGFFALVGASYCLTCGSLADQCRCESDVPPPWSAYPIERPLP